MDDTQKILNSLRACRAAISKKYGISSIGLFGSFARGSADEDSDVDILVEFSEPIGMEIVDLVIELEDLLQREVDLVSTNAIKPMMMPYIEKDLIYVE